MDEVKFLEWTPTRLVQEHGRRSLSPLIQSSLLAKNILGAIERLGTDKRMKDVWKRLFKKEENEHQNYLVDAILRAIEEAYCQTDLVTKDLDTPAKQRDKLLEIAQQVDDLEKSLRSDASAYRVGMGSVRRVVDERWLKECSLISNEVDPETGKSSNDLFREDLVTSHFDDEWSNFRTHGAIAAKKNLFELQESLVRDKEDPEEISNGIETMAWHAIAARRLGVDEVLERLSKDLKQAALQVDRPNKDLVKNLIPRLQDAIQSQPGKSNAQEIATICSVIDGREYGDEIESKRIPRPKIA